MDAIDKTMRDLFASGEIPDFPGARSLIRDALFDGGLRFDPPEIEVDQAPLDEEHGKTCRITDYEWGLSPMSHMPELLDADRALVEYIAKSTRRMIDGLIFGAMADAAEPACTNAPTVSSDPGPFPELAPMPPR